MSAAEGVVRTDSLGPSPTRTTLFSASPPTGAVSPELALVDAGLARDLRAQLPDPAPPSPSAVAEPLHGQVASTGSLRQVLDSEQRARVAGRSRFRKLTVLGLIAFGGLLTVFVRSEPRPSALDRIARAAADPNIQPRTVPAGVDADATPRAQTFVWAAEPGAAAYEFQLFRGDARIYRARVIAPRLVLADRWRQGARSFGLTPASYRWYVWPISARTGSQAAVAKVQATLVVARPNR